MGTHHKIIIGDSREMRDVNDESVHLIVTSPPYWQLKDYGDAQQIGYNDSYENYINNLNLVWKECFRVLHPGCRMAVNIGDQFARSVYYGRYKVIPIRTEIIKFCETIGLDYMGAIIWQKKTTMNTTGGASVMGSYPYPRNGIVEIDYEFILLFRKPGRLPAVTADIKKASSLSKNEWKEYFSGHWHFAGERQKGHLAMFPEELPKRLIRMFSFVGETILDPFLGSGTTSLAAKNTGRNSIGYEISSAFLPLVKKKVGIGNPSLIDKDEFEIIIRDNKITDWNDAIHNLPYIFRDTVRYERKINPKKLNFGSKIDKNSKARDSYYSIKEILAPDELVLNTGVKIRLIGVKKKPSQAIEAMEFLRLKTKGQKVYILFDKEKYDNDGVLMVYLYLKNGTFLNAHLVKLRLVDVDTSIDFRYKTKFLSYRGDYQLK